MVPTGPGRQEGRPIRLVCFDVDGTLSIGHGWRAVAVARGRLRDFDEAQRTFLNGQKGEDDHLVDLLDLARDMPLASMERVLAGTAHLRHLRGLVDRLHDRGAAVALLTHNPTYVCRWYARRFGFDLWAGTDQAVRGGRIQAPELRHVDKVEGLRQLLAATRTEAAASAHVGDGTADARVFPYVATAVALNSTVPSVRRTADVALRTRDALELLPFLVEAARTRPRPLPRRAAAAPAGVVQGLHVGKITS